MKRTNIGPPALAPTLVLPFYTSGVNAAVWPAANRAVFQRFYLPVATTLRYADWTCGVQSGNIQVGAVRLSGTDRTTYTRVMSSGVIACPAAGSVRTDLGATSLDAGDYAMFIWADNTTFQTRYSTASSLTAMRTSAIASSLASGVGTSAATLAWDNVVLNMSLEGDV